LTLIYERKRVVAIALCVGVVAISSVSLANHFFNPRYAKEDIRAAVTFWRADSNEEPLLSVRSQYVLAAYLTQSERERHSVLGADAKSDLELAFAKFDTPAVYVLLARDWGQLREKDVRTAFVVDQERSFPGVKILKVSQPSKQPGAAERAAEVLTPPTTPLLSFAQ
jgi:hypothetical protein